MDLMTAGADLGTMLTGVSAVAAVGFWIRRQWADWQEKRAATKRRTWHGYIDVHGINNWPVRLVEEPETPTSRVVLEVIKDNGEPDPNSAQNLRQRIVEDGMLARVPTENEYDFLNTLYNEHRYNEGVAVR